MSPCIDSPDIEGNRHYSVKDDDVGEEYKQSYHSCTGFFGIIGLLRVGTGTRDKVFPREVDLEVIAGHSLPDPTGCHTDKTD